MRGIVDQKRRFAVMRAHTATHLLHTELASLLPHTKQAGSLVEEDYLRFDFATERLLTDEELRSIEQNINNHISQAHGVTTQESSYDDAIASGAKAFFEDKYGDTVRVVKILDAQDQIVSIELCGGTHVSNTADIGAFCIIGQEAVASGIKRLIALCGPKVVEHVHELRGTLDQVQANVGVKSYNQIPDKLEKMNKEHKELQSYTESLEDKLIAQSLANISSDLKLDNIDIVINISDEQSLANIAFKTIVQAAKAVFAERVVLLYTQEGNFALLANNETISAKTLIQSLGLRGGGNDMIVQGRDPKVADLV